MSAPYFCNIIRMSLASCLPSNWRHRFIWRRRFEDLPDMMCRLPAGRNNTLPVAVTLKRFFAPLLVFILGTGLSSFGHGGRRRTRGRGGGRRQGRRSSSSFASRGRRRRRRLRFRSRGLDSGLGQERHLHPRPGHRDLVLHFRDFVELLLDPLHHMAAVLLVSLLAAAEEDRDEDLI